MKILRFILLGSLFGLLPHYLLGWPYWVGILIIGFIGAQPLTLLEGLSKAYLGFATGNPELAGDGLGIVSVIIVWDTILYGSIVLQSWCFTGHLSW